MSSVVFGALLTGALLALGAMWLPSSVPYLVGLLLLGLLVSAALQGYSGHRGNCLRQRTLRWWLGPIGSLIDPIDVG